MDFRRLGIDLLALGLLAATVFVGLSLVSYDPADPPAHVVYPPRAEALNLCGPTGAYIAHALRTLFGLGAYFVLWSMLLTDVWLFSRWSQPDRYGRLIGRTLAIVALCIALQVSKLGWKHGPLVGSGGYIGAWGATLAEHYFSLAGTLILMASVFIAGLLIANDVFVFRLAFGAFGLTARTAGRLRLPQRKRKAGADDDSIEDLEDETDESPELQTSALPFKVNPPAAATSEREQIIARLNAVGSDTGADHFELPDPSILEDAEEFPYDLLAKKAQVAAQTLEQTFQQFGLNVRVVEVDTGPVITQFELELEAGLRLSKVTALADDLAIALRVPAVRVVAPIPGKNTVGVEVPNEKQVMVRLRELIESSPQALEKNRIPIFVGKDVSGRPLAVDLTKMPHLLIAGRTGTGKSVCLNTLILSMLMTRSPQQVKMLMIDPKMVELSPYKRIPHLMHPVITDMKKAEAVLAWAVDKMEERYDLLARTGVRHLDGYNKLGKEKVLQRLDIDPDSDEADQVPDHIPYIVIIADEMADMMMTSGKDVEGHIIRLAQKSRAVGIHLVLATQKPTVDVITGLIKSNLPARMSFQVASRTDSRVVLDEMGAERLLGNGDMLYLAPGTSNLIRAQGTYVSDDEINEVIDFFGHLEPQYSTELAQLSTSSSGGAADPEAMRKRDDLYEQAIEVVIREGRGSVSLLQRALGIGYGRGARLIDYMAEDGIVGEYNGSQAREVLYTLEHWEAMKAGQLEEAAV